MALLMKALLCGFLCLAGMTLQASDHSLGRGVPSDSVLYFRYRLHPESEVGAALGRLTRETRVGATVRHLMGLGLEALGAEPEDPAAGPAARRTFQVSHWLGLLDGIPWSRFLSREVVLSARLDGERRELLLLFRLDEDLDRALDGLRKLAYAACSLTPALEISESWHERVKSLILYDLLQDEGLAFGGRDGVLLLATSPRLLRRSLQLLAGEGSDVGYHDTRARAERWSCLEGVPDPPGDRQDLLEVHVQVADLLPDVPALGDLRSFTLGAWTQGTELHYRFRTEFGRTELGRLRPLLLDRPTVDLGSLRLPPGATSCELSSGIDLQALLSFAIEISLQAAPQSQPVFDVLRGWGLGRGDDAGSSSDATPPGFWRALRWLSGRRGTLGLPDGIGGWVELRDSGARNDLLALLKAWRPSLEEAGFQILPLEWIGARDGSYRVVLPSLRGGARSPGPQELVIAVTDPVLLWGTSEASLRATWSALSGDATRGWDLPTPSPRPSGDLVAVRSVDRELLERSARLAASVLRGLAEVRGGVSDGARGALQALSGALSALEAAVPVEAATSLTARDGEYLRGGGILRFLRKQEGPEERQF